MNKLTPIFIAGALAISAGLAFAQSQMNKDEAMQGHKMPGKNMSGHTMSASDNPSTSRYIVANDRMHKDMTIDFTGDADTSQSRAAADRLPLRTGTVHPEAIAFGWPLAHAAASRSREATHSKPSAR